MINEVSLLSSHVVLTSERHLYAAVHVMAHICQRYKSRLVYDPLYPEIDHNVLRYEIGQSFIGMLRRLYL